MVYGMVLFLLFLAPRSRTEVPPINEDDPELYVEWTTPSSFEFWWRYSTGAEYVGNLFAGRYQFPWVVDIRSIELDNELWSVGNLLTLSHVLTSNRAIIYVLKNELQHTGGSYDDEGTSVTYELTQVSINYASTYLWEDYKFNALKNWLVTAEEDLFATDVKESGSRFARFLYRHPNWKEGSIIWDIGIIKLNNPIRPLPPMVDHMPFWFNYGKGTVTDVDLSQMENQRRICYVASFGKYWYNLWGSIVTDYKVKYRVYYTDMKKCKDKLILFRREREDRRLTIDMGEKSEDRKHLMCFQTRAVAGSICDHDRGAPLVCDGLVYGFVVRAANYTHCNNLLPLPFLIQKSTVLNSYFASIISHVFIPYRDPFAKASTGRTAPATYIQCFSFLVLLWHLNYLPNHLSFTSKP